MPEKTMGLKVAMVEVAPLGIRERRYGKGGGGVQGMQHPESQRLDLSAAGLAVDGNKLTADFDRAGRKMVRESYVETG
jgi:hypothetical protein